MKDLEIKKKFQIILINSKAKLNVLTRQRQRESIPARGGGHVKTGRDEATQPQTKECLQLPEARRDKEQIFPQSLCRKQPCLHLDLELLASRTIREQTPVV